MSLTVGEVLENAEYNINNAAIPFQIEIGKEQLSNYKVAKELGADDEDNWYDWEDKVSEHKNK
jgi:hypothetical protein